MKNIQLQFSIYGMAQRSKKSQSTNLFFHLNYGGKQRWE